MFALHYSPVKTPAEANKVFGLQVAVTEWLKAWFRYGKQETFNCLIGDTAAQQEIEDAAAAAGLDKSRLALLDQRYVKTNFPRFDLIFRADPDTKRLLWQRQQLDGAGFAFCGLAHAVGGMEGGEAMEQYCLAPSSEADAIVCPSRAIASAISAFWDHYSDYIRARFGTHFHCPVQLPVIPLGIDTQKFAARATPEKRAEQRAKLNLSENEIVLLWVGRLSYAIKAHPIAMFQAAERAAELTGASVHLVMQGYFVPREAEMQIANLARNVCKRAKVTFIASDDARFPDGLWAAGDIFLSLVDNVQESFGLTPIEAMAAGLPRVMSDWDGYRDSVRNGEDGFLVRTLAPPPGAGQDLSGLLLDGREVYGGFLAKTAISTAVDQEMAAGAIKMLIEDKSHRAAIAEKAKARVQSTYDWRHIIPAYEALWSELAAKRSFTAASEYSRVKLNWPTVPDPFAMYATYPTASLKENNRLQVIAEADTIRMLLAEYVNAFALDVMVGPGMITELINHVSAQRGISIAEIMNQYPAVDRPALWRTLGWLIKLGILRAT